MVRMWKTGSRLFGVFWRCYVVVGLLMLHGVHSQRPEILSLHISSDIKYRFATTLVVSSVKNPHKVAKEVVFDVTLPNEAFITDFKMEMDDKVYAGEIKEKEQAKTQYEAARSRGESAAHIQERSRETNKFDVQINVAAESKVIFNLTYQELLRRKRGLYHHVVYIDPGQPVQDMNVRIYIQESRKLNVVRVPPLRNDITDIKGIVSATNNLIIMTRPSPNTAFIQFAPTIEQQIKNDSNGISGQFVVEYDIERSRDAGQILVTDCKMRCMGKYYTLNENIAQGTLEANLHEEQGVVNGYFVHFFAPSGFQPFPKDVLFIVDVSGSMSGRKTEQVKDAMVTILSDLHEGDRINIMTFSTDTNFWRNEMVNCTEENILEAKAFITGKSASGGTNINMALLDGIKHLFKLEESEFRTPMIVFLTDGDATVGETNSEIILENIENENEGGIIPIFSLAFGEDADYDLLKSISSRNYGVARKIYEASDANLQITGFYDEISAALLTDLVFQYLEGSVDNATVTKSHFKRYFDGSEMVVAGKMSKEETKTVPLQVISNSIEGTTVLILNSNILDFGDFTNMTTLASIENITEKMWAYLTIKQIVEKMNAASDAAEKEYLKASALTLSLKYKFVTPVTSMVVTKPETQGEATSNDVGYSVDFWDDTKSRSVRGNLPSLQPRHWSQRLYAFPVGLSAHQGNLPSLQSWYSFQRRNFWPVRAHQGYLPYPRYGYSYSRDYESAPGGIQMYVPMIQRQIPESAQLLHDVPTPRRFTLSPWIVATPLPIMGAIFRTTSVRNLASPLPTMRTIFRTTSVRNHVTEGRIGGRHDKKRKNPRVKTNGGRRKESKTKQDNKNSASKHGSKMYPIRIKYKNAAHATCFNIPDNGRYDSNKPLQLLHSPDGIEINAGVGDLAQRDHLLAINVTVNSTLIEINTTSISILEVHNRHSYDWRSHDVLLPHVKLHVKPSTVKVEADGLSILIHKIGNPSKGLGLFMNETTFPLYSSPTGLLATLAGGISSPDGIIILGNPAGYTVYTLTDLRGMNTWHGDSKCYTLQRDNFS